MQSYGQKFYEATNGQWSAESPHLKDFSCELERVSIVGVSDELDYSLCLFLCQLLKSQFLCLITYLLQDRKLHENGNCSTTLQVQRTNSSNFDNYTRRLYPMMREKFQLVLAFGLTFRGRVLFLMYMPNKPAKFGIKIWCLADVETMYLYNAKVYLGNRMKMFQRTKIWVKTKSLRLTNFKRRANKTPWLTEQDPSNLFAVRWFD